MKIVKLIMLSSILALISACAAPKYEGSAIPSESIGGMSEIVVIEDRETRDGFLHAIEAWLEKNDYEYTVKPADSNHHLEKITIEYTGNWKWDLAIFLSTAKIEAFHNGQRVAEVNYRAPNTLNTNKFGDGAERIEYMLDILFGKISEKEATLAIKK